MSAAGVIDDPQVGNAAPGAAPSSAPAAPIQAQPSGVPEHWGKSWLKSDFTLDPAALERLPDHLKGSREWLSRQRTFEDVLTVAQNAQFLAGKKGLAPLPADAPEAVRTERKQLLDTINGVPPKFTDYKIERPQDISEQHWNPKLVEGFSKWAHDNSVPPAAVKQLVEMQLGTVKGQLQAQADYERNFFAQEAKTFSETVRAENIPEDKAVALVQKGAVALGLDLQDANTQNFLKGSRARLMAMRHALATAEDATVQGAGSGANAENPGASADDIVRNPANPLYAQYWNRDGKFSRDQQNSAVEKVNQLRKLQVEGQNNRRK